MCVTRFQTNVIFGVICVFSLIVLSILSVVKVRSRTHARTRARARAHTHTHTHTHTRSHARTHAHTHTHARTHFRLIIFSRRIIPTFHWYSNRRSSEIQGTALGKCLRAWPVYRSRPAGIAQSRHAFVGGTVSTWARRRIAVNKGRKGIRNADQAFTVRGEHADRIVGSPSW